jgi:hypothetical protein
MRVKIALLVAAFACSFGGSQAATLRQAPHHSHRYLIAVRVVRGVARTPLRGLGWLIERVGHQEGVSPFFMVGASGVESSVFRAPCAGNPRNGWGLGSCSSAWRAPHFATWEQSFTYFARHVRRLWPSARTPYDLHGYCGCGSAAWGSRTIAWIHQLFGSGVPTGVRYP